MGNGAEQGVSQSLGFDFYLDSFRVSGEMDAFQGGRRLACQGFEEVDLLRIVETIRLPRLDPDHANDSA